jgi:hypothetical protein
MGMPALRRSTLTIDALSVDALLTGFEAIDDRITAAASGGGVAEQVLTGGDLLAGIIVERAAFPNVAAIAVVRADGGG